ncbi:MAG: MBL fold metallo-hydrolase, partial [Patescibacteria group bacterium]|nr:MBL fold metallo-hydrolase [Patescibacteria group bacterium]
MDNGIKADIFFISAALLILANVYLWQFVFSLGSNLKVVFFDVGEGDGIFIETPQGHQILIDGGPGGQILGKLQKQMPFWDRTVDLAILTHPEYDHLAGLNAVLQHYKAQNILWTGVVKDTAVVREWLGLLRKEGASVFIVRDGQTIKAGTVEGSVLWPTESFVDAFSGNDVNNTAIVLKMDYIKNSFLFSGDIEQKIEKELVGYYG